MPDYAHCEKCVRDIALSCDNSRDIYELIARPCMSRTTFLARQVDVGWDDGSDPAYPHHALLFQQRSGS
jgi:hypothetical protein